MSPSVTIHEHDDGQIQVLEFQGPKGNVLDRELVEQLRAAVAGLAARPRVKAVVLEGQGPHFCFGASVDDHLPERMPDFLPRFHGLLRELLDLQRPLLAVVRGLCLGGGLELASVCHRILLSPEARVGQPEIKLAVFAPAASVLLPARCGQPVADDLLLSGRLLDAGTAVSLRVADWVGEDPAAEALAYAREHLVPRAASALGHATRAARLALRAQLDAHLDRVERQYLEEVLPSPDAIEGLQAFLEKRTPRYPQES